MAAVDNLWAPWRLEYVTGDSPPGCVLCAKPSSDANGDQAALILHRGVHCYVVLNLFPYNPGHLMVVPFRHVAQLDELTAAELIEAQILLRRSIRTLRARMQPGGFNIGLNLGSAAGAGIPDHLHWQLVPRWDGDTNFMPVLADVRVMPQLLQTTWAELVEAWNEYRDTTDEELIPNGV